MKDSKMALNQIGNMSYHIDDKLIFHWNKNSLRRMKKQNMDRCYIVDGMERSGKSTWTFQQAAYLDEEMFSSPEKMVSRICFSPDDFIKTIRETKNGVIIFDEAFRGLSSRAAISKVNKSIIQALMEMGQQNNIVFIILPSFFLLDIYPAMLRSHGLFNIYSGKKATSRSWRGFNKHDKNIIYKEGLKKGWTYNRNTRFKGKFPGKFPGGKDFEQAYLKKKADALKDLGKAEDEKVDNRKNYSGLGWNYLGCFLDVLKERKIGMGIQKEALERVKRDYGVEMDRRTLWKYVKKAKESSLVRSH